MKRERIILGLMSGTSCDGVDAVLARVRGRGLQMRVAYAGMWHAAYPTRLRRRLLAAMCPADTTTAEITSLHGAVGRFLARAARRAIDRLNGGAAPDAVGSHGQTICHLPSPRGRGAGLQIGEPAWIAAALGCPVVADFRHADQAVGGEGAPLVPWTDWVLLRDRRRARAVQNIGGIANVTFLPARARPNDVIAFDCGPGNMIIDELVRTATSGRLSYDRDGRIAASGRVLESVLRRWMRHPFLRRTPPKSAGREQFGAAFVASEMPRLRSASPKSEDWIATATAFTASAIVDAYRRFLPSRGGRPAVDEVVLCGGGGANPTLTAALASRLPGVAVRSIAALGIPLQAKEALSFAVLAAAFLDGVPANLPRVTGARMPAVLGKLCLPPPTRRRGYNPRRTGSRHRN